MTGDLLSMPAHLGGQAPSVFEIRGLPVILDADLARLFPDCSMWKQGG